jgi:hypothetical protein
LPASRTRIGACAAASAINWCQPPQRRPRSRPGWRILAPPRWPSRSTPSSTPQLPPYNGWINYPTWAIFTWLTNEEPLSRAAEQIVADAHGHPLTAADNLQEWVEGMIAEHFDTGCLALDLANFALSAAQREAAAHCEWRDLVGHLSQALDEAAAQTAGLGDYEDTPAYGLGW